MMRLRSRSELQSATERNIAKSIGIDPFENQPRGRSQKKRNRSHVKKRAVSRHTTVGSDGNKIVPNYILQSNYAPKEREKLVRPSLDSLLAMSLDELEEDDLSNCQEHLLDTSVSQFDGNVLTESIKSTIEKEIHINYPPFDYINFETQVSKHRVLSDAHCIMFLPVSCFQNPILSLVLNEDCSSFFRYAYQHLVHPNSMEHSQCLCDYYFSRFYLVTKEMHVTPLHLAAAYNRHGFLRAVLIDYRKWFDSIDPNMPDEILNHFKRIVQNWYGSVLFDSKPYDIAAENDHKESLEVFMNYEYFKDEIFQFLREIELNKMSKKRPFDCYPVSQLDTFFCKLSFYNNLNLISEDILIEAFSLMKDDHVLQMIRDALWTGNEESFQLIVKYMNRSLTARVNRTRTGRYDSLGKPIRPELAPPVHLAALNGHWNLFERGMRREIDVRDCFGYSPLVSCVSFDDEQLKKAYMLVQQFAAKEEILVLVHHLILKKRYNMATYIARFLLRDGTIFTRRINDESYGLPEDVPLPLESILITNGDVAYFQEIIKLYIEWRSSYSQAMIEEDVIRCVIFIQYHSFDFCDQIRLAILLMLIPLAPVQTELWKRKLKINRSLSGKDPVAEHVLKVYNSPNICQKMPLLDWKDALAKAREMITWDGRCLEEDDEQNVQFVRFWRSGSSKTPGRSCLRV